MKLLTFITTDKRTFIIKLDHFIRIEAFEDYAFIFFNIHDTYVAIQQEEISLEQTHIVLNQIKLNQI